MSTTAHNWTMAETDTGRKFQYFINLDERGSFRADVRNEQGETVYEILAGDELAEDETSIFDDGFMAHKHDILGLASYLQSLGIIGADDSLSQGC